MNIGLIGCGRAASVHMLVYQNLANARVVAVSDIDNRKAKVFGKKYGISKVFSDYKNVLEVKDLDFVDICTPTSTHSSLACDAAKSGRNILLEKPMARSVEECERIINESKANGIKLCIVHNQLFFPSVMLLKRLMSSGHFEPMSLRTSYKVCQENNDCPDWTFTNEEKGILWEFGYHLAYHQLEFLKDVREIHACAAKVKYPVYDKIGVLLCTAKSHYGIMELSMTSEATEILLEVDTSNGKKLRVDLTNDSITEEPMKQASRGTTLFSVAKKFLRSVTHPKATKAGLGYSIGHYHLIRKYINSVKQDTSPPIQPEEGREAVRLLSLVEKSIEKTS